MGELNHSVSLFHRELHLQNVEIIVADISTFEMEASYDRIFSIEMFEVHSSFKSSYNV